MQNCLKNTKRIVAFDLLIRFDAFFLLFELSLARPRPPGQSNAQNMKNINPIQVSDFENKKTCQLFDIFSNIPIPNADI